MYTPAYPSFAIEKWGSRGIHYMGHVFLMVLFESYERFYIFIQVRVTEWPPIGK